ncbi:Sld5 domain-containing protein [Meloidogyne graminicola]|uniref:DNA replication complex GINS protein PSF1 n=1 Tax=Meloidogyne graminicola TaxID=189291 RepID=A0A8S9ZJB3_9BILA|nr:Sld5 domain-containing protein [Meloidogyne graminicola]
MNKNGLKIIMKLLLNFKMNLGKEDEENDEGEINGGNGVNLFNFVDPPDKLMVKVRAIKDSGEFETSDGITIILSKGAVHLLPRQDCENLVRKVFIELPNVLFNR